MQLLVRHPRKVVPTDAGRAFHEHCDALISHVNSRLEAASTEVQGMSSGGTGRLCILSDNQFLTTFVCHMVRHFLERYANIACELHVSERADSPGVKEVDCYVCAQAPDRRKSIGKLVGRLGYGLYASPENIRVHGTPMTPEDLALHAAIKLR